MSYKVRNFEGASVTPEIDCCDHENSQTFTLCNLANKYRTNFLSSFHVMICDNCGMVYLCGKSLFRMKFCEFLLKYYSNYNLYIQLKNGSRFVKISPENIMKA